MTDGYGAKKSKEQFPVATLEDQRKWTQLVKSAWADDTLKQRLLNDPAPLLREHGIAIPAGADVLVGPRAPIPAQDLVGAACARTTPAGFRLSRVRLQRSCHTPATDHF